MNWRWPSKSKWTVLQILTQLLRVMALDMYLAALVKWADGNLQIAVGLRDSLKAAGSGWIWCPAKWPSPTLSPFLFTLEAVINLDKLRML